MSKGKSTSTKKRRFIWGKEAVTALIELYQNQPILYDLKDPNYKNKVKREAAISGIYEELLKIPMCHAQCLDTEDVKTKIHTLRSQFNKEYKKRKDSLTTGASADHVYNPNLWFYDQMLFLKDVDEPSQSFCNIMVSKILFVICWSPFSVNKVG